MIAIGVVEEQLRNADGGHAVLLVFDAVGLEQTFGGFGLCHVERDMIGAD